VFFIILQTLRGYFSVYFILPTASEFDFLSVSCDPSGCSTIASASSTNSINAPSPTPEDDRGFRKKSREKMRRQEVNVKVRETASGSLHKATQLTRISDVLLAV